MRVGSGIWLSQDNPLNISIPVHSNLPQSNDVAEMLAIYHAAKRIPSGHRLHIKTDSMWCINTLHKDLTHLEDTNYINLPIREIIRATVSALRSRPNITTLEWVKGHSNVLGNKKADGLVVQGANIPT